MSYSRRSSSHRYASCSPSPYRHDARSGSGTRSRSPDFSDAENPGNNLYVTGLSPRVKKIELEKHFANEGKVVDVHLVLDPWTRESRGFGFVTMATIEDANRCLKYLDGSVLEGRVITVQKARRRRGRTPTPGRYLGARTFHSRRRSPSDSSYHRSRYRSPSNTYVRDRSYSPCYRRHRSYSRSISPYYRHDSVRRRRSCSWDSRSYSPVHCVSPYYRGRYYRSHCRSISPRVRRHSRSLSPRERSRSYTCSFSPRSIRRTSRRSYSRSFSRSVSPRERSRSYTCSVSPGSVRRTSRRSYSRSFSPKQKYSRRHSRSYSPVMRRSMRSRSRSASPRKSSRRYSRESYSHSRSIGFPWESASSSWSD